MKKSNHFIIAIILLFISIIVFWSYIVPENQVITTPDTYISDSIHLNFSLKYILSSYYKTFKLPWWTDTVGNGFPLIGESQIGAFYLPNIIFFSLLPFPYAYNVGYIFTFWICSLGSFYFYKLFIKNKLYSFLAALFFTYSYPLSVQQTHYNLLQAYSLFPFIMYTVHGLFIDNLSKRIKMLLIIILSFLLSQQFNTGYSGMSIITGVTLFIYIFVFSIVYKNSKLHRFKSISNLIYKYLIFVGRKILILLSIFTTTFFLSFIQLIPLIEYTLGSNRSGGMSTNFIGGAYSNQFLLTYFYPFITGFPNQLFEKFGNLSWEAISFIGFVPIILFFYKLLRRKMTNVHKRLLVLIVILLAFMLGIGSPLYFLYTLPPLSFLRTPFRFMILANFFIIAFSFMSLDRVQLKIKLIYFAIVLILIIDLLHNIFLFKNVHTYTAHTNIRLNQSLNHFINNQNNKLFVLGLEKEWSDGRKINKPSKYFIDIINTLPTAYVSSYFHVNSGNIFHGSDFHDKYVLPFYNNLFSLYSTITSDHESKNPEYMESFCNQLINGIKLFGSTHVLSVKSLSSCKENVSFKNLVSPEKHYLYEIKNSNRIYYFPKAIVSFLGVRQFISHLNDSNYQSAHVSNIMSGYMHEKNIVTSKEVSVYQNIIHVKTYADNQLLIDTSLYYPGWVAYIDGKPTGIHRVNLIQRGILIPKKGNHVIEIKYKPKWKPYVVSITIVSHFILITVGLVLLIKVYRSRY